MVREFFGMFLLVLASFVLLMLVFTFFELVGDIVRNHIALTTVGEYLLQPTPKHDLHHHAAGGADLQCWSRLVFSIATAKSSP